MDNVNEGAVRASYDKVAADRATALKDSAPPLEEPIVVEIAEPFRQALLGTVRALAPDMAAPAEQATPPVTAPMAEWSAPLWALASGVGAALSSASEQVPRIERYAFDPRTLTRGSMFQEVTGKLSRIGSDAELAQEAAAAAERMAAAEGPGVPSGPSDEDMARAAMAQRGGGRA